MKQASSRCSHCGATPSERQDPNLMFRAKPEALALMCVSVLHFGPRTMENFLNIGFRQDFEAWQRRTPEQRAHFHVIIIYKDSVVAFVL